MITMKWMADKTELDSLLGSSESGDKQTEIVRAFIELDLNSTTVENEVKSIMKELGIRIIHSSVRDILKESLNKSTLIKTIESKIKEPLPAAVEAIKIYLELEDFCTDPNQNEFTNKFIESAQKIRKCLNLPDLDSDQLHNVATHFGIELDEQEMLLNPFMKRKADKLVPYLLANVVSKIAKDPKSSLTDELNTFITNASVPIGDVITELGLSPSPKDYPNQGLGQFYSDQPRGEEFDQILRTLVTKLYDVGDPNATVRFLISPSRVRLIELCKTDKQLNTQVQSLCKIADTPRSQPAFRTLTEWKKLSAQKVEGARKLRVVKREPNRQTSVTETITQYVNGGASSKVLKSIQEMVLACTLDTQRLITELGIANKSHGVGLAFDNNPGCKDFDIILTNLIDRIHKSQKRNGLQTLLTKQSKIRLLQKCRTNKKFKKRLTSLLAEHRDTGFSDWVDEVYSVTVSEIRTNLESVSTVQSNSYQIKVAATAEALASCIAEGDKKGDPRRNTLVELAATVIADNLDRGLPADQSQWWADMAERVTASYKPELGKAEKGVLFRRLGKSIERNHRSGLRI